MKHDKLIALCQRHNAVLLNSEDDVLTIAVVDNPSPMLMESLSFAVQQRVDIRCWTQDQMDKHQQMTVQTHLRPSLKKAVPQRKFSIRPWETSADLTGIGYPFRARRDVLRHTVTRRWRFACTLTPFPAI